MNFLSTIGVFILLLAGCKSQGRSEVLVSFDDQWQSKRYWEEQSELMLNTSFENLDRTKLQLGQFIEQNRYVTAAYAELFLRGDNDQRFYWSGLAAFASEMVGQMMQDFKKRSSLIGLGQVYADAGVKLGEGNARVFLDIYWQHLAFENGGLALMKYFRREQELSQGAIDAWEAKNAWLMTEKIAFVEQHDILQPAIFSSAYAQLAGTIFSNGMRSPVPGGTPYRESKSLSIFEARWRWIKETVLGEWREWLTQHESQTREYLQCLVDRLQTPKSCVQPQ